MGSMEIISAIAASRRAVRMYPPAHPAHREAVRGLCQAVGRTVNIQPLVLSLREGRLYEGSEALADNSPAIRAVAGAMAKRRIDSVTLRPGFNETDAEGISIVLGLRPSPDLRPQGELEATGAKAVAVTELEDAISREAEARERQRESDRSLHRNLLSAIDNVQTAIAEGAPTDSSEVARAIAPLVERVAEDPPAMLALAYTTGAGDRWHFRVAAVTLNTLVLGYRMGLSDRLLLELGVAASLHDLGERLNSEEDAESIRLNHPATGARVIGMVSGEGCAAMIVAYEHHMGVDGSGWPARQEGYAIHPFSRIVAVADRFDELIHPEKGPGMRPDEAITTILQEGSGGPLDPVMARLFAQMMGPLPVGTIARLSDSSVGIVHSAGANPLLPRLRLVLGTDGTLLRPAVDLDLGRCDVSIVELLSPAVVGLEPGDHL
jgi:hypothetical protein